MASYVVPAALPYAQTALPFAPVATTVVPGAAFPGAVGTVVAPTAALPTSTFAGHPGYFYPSSPAPSVYTLPTPTYYKKWRQTEVELGAFDQAMSLYARRAGLM